MANRLQITYAGYNFHDEGVPQYGSGITPDQGNHPAKLTESFRVKMRFFEESFADVEARWHKLKTVLRNNPRGRLVIRDENDSTLESRTVRFTGHDGDAEWGQFRREVTVTFEAAGGTGIVPEFTATYTPAGGLPVTLPNVDKLGGARTNERYSPRSPLRSQGTEKLTASGRWSPPGSYTDLQKREALLAMKLEIQSIAGSAEGVFTYGGFSETMQVESVSADIGDGMDALTWSVSCTRNYWPDGSLAEVDYTVEYSDEMEEARRTLSVSGKVIAGTEAQARAEAERVRLLFKSGRAWLGGSTTKRVIEGGDGTEPCLELSFTWRFRENLAVVSWKLKATSTTDARTGDVTSTWSGNVVARNATAALAKARALGDRRDSEDLLLLSKSEDVSTVHVHGSADQFAGVEFSYAYLGKSAVAFAEVQTEQSQDFFGANTLTVSGSVTAADKETALLFARTFQPEGVLVLSTRESDGLLVQDEAGRHFTRLDFTYTCGKTATHVTAAYARQVQNDLEALTTTVTWQGQAAGPDIRSCDTLIDSLIGVNLTAKARKLRDDRTDEWKQDLTDHRSLFLSRPFSVSYVMPLTGRDAADIDIIDATWSIAVRWGLWKAVIDEIPYAAPFVQTDVRLSCGSITVSGNVTSVRLETGRTWARGKRRHATGYLDNVEETEGYVMLPRSGTEIQRHTFAFSYQSNDPDKVWAD